MSTIKFEFPADRKDIALAISRALAEIGGGLAETAKAIVADPIVSESAGHDVEATQVPEPAPSDAKVDTKGVPFDPNFCAKAQDPFYATGKRAGQWKKRKGVTDDAYGEWYAGQLLGHTITEEPFDEPAAGEPFDASAAFDASAFGAGQQQQQATESDAPADGAAFMKWVSENQAAGKIPDGAVEAAYQATGFTLADLFGAKGAEAAKAAYDWLKANIQGL